ncbi:MAG TPA: formate dehydrogenase accessory sulfurtransferase FdhD [Acidimicrobiales bacterium]
MARGRTAKVLTRHFDGPTSVQRPDQLIVEEPLEIHLDGVLVATTMRTPGHDFELAAGFCHTEGLLAGAPVRRARYCGTGSAVDSEFNVVTVDTGGVAPTPTPRLTATTSACGMCGTTAVDELRERLHPLPATPPFRAEVLARLADRAAGAQDLFDATGGVHAAMLFDGDGEPLLVREDIGRHNAVDKVVGRLLLDGRLPATGLGLWVSGRAGFEIVQKAWAAGIGTVVAVSAPSSLAVSAARLAGMTLCGFARGPSFNVYAGEVAETAAGTADADAPATLEPRG